jgi:hypothetical protein
VSYHLSCVCYLTPRCCTSRPHCTPLSRGNSSLDGYVSRHPGGLPILQYFELCVVRAAAAHAGCIARTVRSLWRKQRRVCAPPPAARVTQACTADVCMCNGCAFCTEHHAADWTLACACAARLRAVRASPECTTAHACARLHESQPRAWAITQQQATANAAPPACQRTPLPSCRAPHVPFSSWLRTSAARAVAARARRAAAQHSTGVVRRHHSGHAPATHTPAGQAASLVRCAARVPAGVRSKVRASLARGVCCAFLVPCASVISARHGVCDRWLATRRRASVP